MPHLITHSHIVLASNSPRRKQLLSLGGWDFIVSPVQVDERVLPGEAPQDYVRRLAETKVRSLCNQGGLPESVLALAADTAVVDEKHILGKPVDALEAESMLRRLRGRAHQVYSGLAVLAVERSLTNGHMLSDVCVSEVVMRDYSDAEMLAYIESGDPLDKAGAYAIQHALFKPVKHLQGCYANVMGLPLCHLVRLLAEFGLPPVTDVVNACQHVLNTPCQVYTQVTGAGQ